MITGNSWFSPPVKLNFTRKGPSFSALVTFL